MSEKFELKPIEDKEYKEESDNMSPNDIEAINSAIEETLTSAGITKDSYHLVLNPDNKEQMADDCTCTGFIMEDRRFELSVYFSKKDVGFTISCESIPMSANTDQLSAKLAQLKQINDQIKYIESTLDIGFMAETIDELTVYNSKPFEYKDADILKTIQEIMKVVRMVIQAKLSN